MSKGNILLIEDHAVTRKNISRFLRDEGFEIRDVEDAREALSLLNPNPDLIITDYVLPGLGGREFLKLLRSRTSLTPIILVSATITEDIVHDIQECKINAHLVKPIDLNELLDRIYVVLEKNE